MALNLAKAILDCLKARPEEKLTARQIAEWILVPIPRRHQEVRDCVNQYADKHPFHTKEAANHL
ncbi:MAG: hypothetical protein ACK53K_10880 [Burkholderiales bacterium]|jgi:hypothetical protein